MREKDHVPPGAIMRVDTKYDVCSEKKNGRRSDFSRNESPEKELL